MAPTTLSAASDGGERTSFCGGGGGGLREAAAGGPPVAPHRPTRMSTLPASCTSGLLYIVHTPTSQAA
jgi:hypothetical protein